MNELTQVNVILRSIISQTVPNSVQQHPISQPAAVQTLPIGTMLSGNLVGKDPRGGGFTLRTPKGDVLVKTDLNLPLGAKVELLIENSNESIRARIVAVDGRSLELPPNPDGVGEEQPSIITTTEQNEPQLETYGKNFKALAFAQAAKQAIDAFSQAENQQQVEVQIEEPVAEQIKQLKQQIPQKLFQAVENLVQGNATILKIASNLLPQLASTVGINVQEIPLVQQGGQPVPQQLPSPTQTQFNQLAQRVLGPLLAEQQTTANQPQASAKVPEQIIQSTIQTLKEQKVVDSLFPDLSASNKTQLKQAPATNQPQLLNPELPNIPLKNSAPIAQPQPGFIEKNASQFLPQINQPQTQAQLQPQTLSAPQPQPQGQTAQLQPQAQPQSQTTQLQQNIAQQSLPAENTTQAPQPQKMTMVGNNLLIPAETFQNVETNEVLIRTPIGIMRPSPGQQLEPGVQFALVVSENPVEKSQPTVIFPDGAKLADKTVPARFENLDALIRLAQQIEQPHLMNTINQMVPQPNRKMAASMLFLLSAISGGNLRRVMGEAFQAENEISSRAEIIKKAIAEISGASQRITDKNELQWQAYYIPVFDGEKLNQLSLYVKRDPDKQKKSGNEGEDSRFVFDVKFSHLGRMQFDGFLKGQRNIELVLRSEAILPDTMKSSIYGLFNDAMELTGYKGSIMFLVTREFAVELADALPPYDHEGVVV